MVRYHGERTACPLLPTRQGKYAPEWRGLVEVRFEDNTWYRGQVVDGGVASLRGTEHLVHFDDGDRGRFNLTEGEQAGYIRVLGSSHAKDNKTRKKRKTPIKPMKQQSRKRIKKQKTQALRECDAVSDHSTTSPPAVLSCSPPSVANDEPAPESHASAAPESHASAAPESHASAAPESHSSAAPESHSSAAPGSGFDLNFDSDFSDDDDNDDEVEVEVEVEVDDDDDDKVEAVFEVEDDDDEGLPAAAPGAADGVAEEVVVSADYEALSTTRTLLVERPHSLLARAFMGGASSPPSAEQVVQAFDALDGLSHHLSASSNTVVLDALRLVGQVMRFAGIHEGGSDAPVDVLRAGSPS